MSSGESQKRDAQQMLYGDGIPVGNVREYIVDLAARHSVTYIKTSDDELAETITGLSDDEVSMDEVELLLIAMERSGVIASSSVVPLHINYLREKCGRSGLL